MLYDVVCYALMLYAHESSGLVSHNGSERARNNVPAMNNRCGTCGMSFLSCCCSSMGESAPEQNAHAPVLVHVSRV